MNHQTIKIAIRRTSLLCFLLAMGLSLFAQPRAALRISARYGLQADYFTHYQSALVEYQTRLWGMSYAIDGSLAFPIGAHTAIRTGIGYYYLGIDRIRQTRTPATTGSARMINYTHPSGILPLFSTSRYHYDNLAPSLGLERSVPLSRGKQLLVRAEGYYLLNFSRLYAINYDGIRYREYSWRGLGYGTQLELALQLAPHKRGWYLQPGLILPLFQRLSGDPILGESRSQTMDKWWPGGGVLLTIGKQR